MNDAAAADPPGWLRALRERGIQPPLRPRLPLRLAHAGAGAGAGAGADADAGAAADIGSIEPELAQRLQDAGLPLRRHGGACIVDGEPNAALAALAQWLHAQALASRWRDELLAVADPQGRVHAAIERAAVRPLGITTTAVHLVGRHPDGRWWLQQRAFDKATDPGLWDTLMGGLVAAGERIDETLARETWEEAGLRLAELRGLAPLGRLTVRRPVAEGYMVEHMHLFEAQVPAGLRPANQDGEVVAFDCVDTSALRERLAAGVFTLEAALILAHALDHRPQR